MKWIYKFQEGSQESESKAEAALLLSRELSLGKLAATVCVNRGMQTVDQARSFLNPKLDQLTPPSRILDLDKAVEHILATQNLLTPQHFLDTQAKSKSLNPQKIRVYTDYDVDGTTGAALLTWFFRDLNFNFDVTQPDRFKDGYGLNPGAIEKASADGVHTLITVDCGITNFEAAEKAKELGIGLIIIDHHQVDPIKGIPHAIAVVNPQRSDDTSGLKQLCGCALAFYLCMAIRSKLRESKYFENTGIKEPNLKNLLDLVVIATAADMVPLTGDNRILVRHGLEVLRNTNKPGLRALIEAAGIEVKAVSPSNLGFALGPRINASGRMGSAETAYRVLTTQNPEEGRALAAELEVINKKRAELQNQIWDQVREKIDQGIEKGKYEHAVVVASPDWHEGVVGIVASKVTDHFKRPAIILAVREDGIAKGSVRSYGGYNVLEALHLSKDFLKGYGGHKYAAGLSLVPENVDSFCDHYNAMIATLKPSHDPEKIELESLCTLQDFTARELEELERLAPFGPGNPEPVFALAASIDTQTVLKGRHLKLRFVPEKKTSNGPDARKITVEGIWFNAAERIEFTELVEHATVSKKSCLFAGIPELNRFMGRSTPTLRIKAATFDPAKLTRLLILILMVLPGVLLMNLAIASQTKESVPALESSPAATPMVNIVPSPAPLLTDPEKRLLYSDFKKALSNEEKAFNQRERSEGKQFSASQASRRKNWFEQEKKTRHVFFDQHLSGPDRRQYVQDYLIRKKQFEKSQKDELDHSREDWKNKRDALKKNLKERDRAFKTELDRGRRPGPELWKRFY